MAQNQTNDARRARPSHVAMFAEQKIGNVANSRTIPITLATVTYL